MNIALWIVQGLLSVMFLMAGTMKATQPKEKLALKMPWVNDFSAIQVKIIGTLQFLAAIGLVLPMLLNIAPILTPLAAVGLMLTMSGAAIYHVTKQEYKEIAVNLVLLCMAAFVAFGRF